MLPGEPPHPLTLALTLYSPSLNPSPNPNPNPSPNPITTYCCCFQVTSAEVQFLKAEAPLPGQYSLTEPTSSEPEHPPPMSSSGLGAGKGDGRLEIDEMLEWLDSGTGLKDQSAECLS